MTAPSSSAARPRALSDSGASAEVPWIKFKTDTGLWKVAPGYASPAFLQRLSEPETLLQPPAELLRPEERVRSTRLARALFPELPDTPVLIKQYLSRWSDGWKELIRASRAERAVFRSRLLERLGIPTAAPIAAGRLRRRGLPHGSIFICRFLEETKPLRYFRRVAPQRGQGRLLMRNLGRLMAQLHQAGLSHSDPTLSNFLVRLTGAPPAELVVVDVDALRPMLRMTRALIMRDLEQLIGRIPMSPRERLWFASGYARAAGRVGSARELLADLNWRPDLRRSELKRNR